MESVYSWLVQASLGMVIPALMVLGGLLLSKNHSSSARSAILWGGALLLVIAPFVRLTLHPASLIHCTIPALERLQAYSEEHEILDEELQRDLVFRHLQPPPEVTSDEQEKLATALWIQWIFWIWLVGAAVVFLRHLGTYLKSLRLLAAARMPENKAFLETITQSAEKLEISPPPIVLLSKKCRSPFTGGLFRPAIVTTDQLLTESRETQEMILIHEFAHLKRRDVVRNLPMIWLQVVFWFHPLVWFLIRRAYAEAEKACDDAVLLAGHSAVNYSELLVGMSAGRDRFLQERISALASVERERTPLGMRLRLVIAGVSFALLLFTAFIHFSPWPKDQPITPLEIDGLAAHWEFNRGRGSIIADLSGNDCHGRIQGAKWENDMERGDVLRFDGKNDYVIFRAPDMDFTKDNYTISLWLKLDPDSDGGGLIMKGDRNGVWNGGSEKFRGKRLKYGERGLMLSGIQPSLSYPSAGLLPSLASYGNAFIQAKDPLPTNEWVNLTFCCEHAQANKENKVPMAWLHIYINGKRVSDYLKQKKHSNGIDMVTLDWVTNVWYVGVGEAYVVHDNHFEGQLQSVSVFNRNLTQEEIKQFYQTGRELKGQ